MYTSVVLLSKQTQDHVSNNARFGSLPLEWLLALCSVDNFFGSYGHCTVRIASVLWVGQCHVMVTPVQ